MTDKTRPGLPLCFLPRLAVRCAGGWRCHHDGVEFGNLKFKGTNPLVTVSEFSGWTEEFFHLLLVMSQGNGTWGGPPDYDGYPHSSMQNKTGMFLQELQAHWFLQLRLRLQRCRKYSQ